MPWHGDKALWNSASMSYLLSTPNFLFNSLLSPKLICTFQTTVVAFLFRTDNETLLKQNRGRGSSLAQMPSTRRHYSLIWSPHIFRAILILSPALRNPCFVPRDVPWSRCQNLSTGTAFPTAGQHSFIIVAVDQYIAWCFSSILFFKIIYYTCSEKWKF